MVELVAGVCLITGVAYRGANALVGGLLVFFIILLSINLGRGHAVDCGCFQQGELPRTEEEKFRDMKVVIARDVGLLVLVGLVACGAKQTDRGRGGGGGAPLASPSGNAA